MSGSDPPPPINKGKSLDGKVNEKPSGAKIERRKSISVEGQYIPAQEGDTLCGLAKAFYGPNEDCRALREHKCNEKLRDVPLKAGQRVFFPALTSKEPKEARKVISIQITGGVPNKGLTITTVPPTAYDKIQDPNQFSVALEDPFHTQGKPYNQVTLDVLYPTPENPVKYNVCPRRALPRPDKGIPAPIVVQNARALELDVGNDGKTKPFRLVTQEGDRIARPHDTLLVRELATGEIIDDKNSISAAVSLRAEILQMKVRATYKVPWCKSGCMVAAERALDPGRTVKLAVRILRTKFTGGVATSFAIPLPVLAAYTTAGQRNAVVIDRQKVQETIATVVRRLWAEARVQFNIVKMEVCDPPSDMIAVGDWDGKRQDPPPSHLPPNGKPAAKQYTVKFTAKWTQNEDSKKPALLKPIQVAIAEGATPQAAAEQIATAINKAFDPERVAHASPNPKQTNGAQASCDVVLRPPTGYMLIEGIEGATDVAQTVHVIHFDTDPKAQVVISNFPESFHIGSPQFRMIMKAFPRDNADVKIVFASKLDLAVASSVVTAEGFGLGQMADFDDLRPSEEVRDSIIGGENLVKNERKTLLAHELGHVLIDTPGHVDVSDQLMFAKPPKGEGGRIQGYLPQDASWEAPQRDTQSSALRFVDMPRSRTNAAARVHREANAVALPLVPNEPDKFEALDSKALKAIQQGIKDLFDALLEKAQPPVTELVHKTNYFPVRVDDLEGWVRYFDLSSDPERGSGRVEEMTNAFLAGLTFGSDAIKDIIRGDQTVQQAKVSLKQLGQNPEVQRKAFALKLAQILNHAERRVGFSEVSEGCAAVMPSDSKLVGYTGKYLDLDRKIDGNAVFVSIERFGRPGALDASGQRKQPGSNRARHYYSTLHEVLHLQSYKLRGFHAYKKKPAGVVEGSVWDAVLNEGATELFTRLVYYHSFAKLEDGPSPNYFGFDPNQFIPAYEVVKNVVAQMAKDAGIKLLARAYFLGDFDPFFEALPPYNYTEWFWGSLSKLDISPPPYLDPRSEANQANDALSIQGTYPMCLKAASIFEWMKGGEFKNYAPHDPAQEILKLIF